MFAMFSSWAGPLQWIFGSGIRGHGFLSFGDSRRRFAQTCIGQTQILMQLGLSIRMPRRYFLEFGTDILHRLLVSCARSGDVAGALLTQAKREMEPYLVLEHRFLERLVGQCF